MAELLPRGTPATGRRALARCPNSPEVVLAELFYPLTGEEQPRMSELEGEYRLEYFEDNDFVRKECTECGDHFWTRDHDRTTCGEPPCEEYGFIDNPGFDEELSLTEMR